MSPRAIIFGAEPGLLSAFEPAIVLGRNLPPRINDQPVSYWWKEMLPPAADFRNGGEKVDPARINVIIECFNRAKAKGYKAFLPAGSHKERTKNYGWLIDVRRNDRGALEGLHQVIGEDARRELARNGSSICTIKNVIDEDGERYEELIDHNAILPDPKVFTLGDFVPFNPALAASRGQTIGAEYVSLVASKQESPMDLTALRKALGAADSVADADLIAQAATKLTTPPDVIQLSRADKAKLDGDLAAARSKVGELETKVTELSRSAGDKAPAAPDPEALRDRADITVDRINVAVAKGEMPQAFATKLIDKVKPAGGQPNAFMLSRNDAIGDRPADFVLSLFAGEKFGVKTGEATGGQSHEFSRNPPQPPGGKKEQTKEEIDAAVNAHLAQTELGRRALASAAK